MSRLLEIRDLQVRYGAVAALRGIDLDLDAGQTLSLCGPNGAGKSTLMKALAGWLQPHAGRIIFDGQAVSGCAPEALAALGLSLVPEGRQVFGALTVLENLRVGAGMRRDKRAVAADLDYVFDLWPMLRERAHAQAGLLSGGQQQMLVIARGLMAGPKLLAIDEPSLGLAPKVCDQVYEALLRLRRERQIGLLLVEQSPGRAALAGARMLMLRGGKVVLEGDPRTLPAEALRQAYFGLEAPGVPERRCA